MIYYVYILKSQVRNRFYIGSTADYTLRLEQHNAGSTKSTKPYRPWILMYTEKYESKEQACKREWHLKHPKGYLEKLAIINKHGEVA